MADLGGNFDPNAVPEREGGVDGEPIPAGTEVLAHIIEDEAKDTRNGGFAVIFTWEILEGQPYARRRVWDFVNINNASEKAQEIGQRHLADIWQATGAPPSRNTSVLHRKPCLIRIGIEKGNGINPKTGQPYPDKNKVMRVKPVGAMVPQNAGVSRGQPKQPATRPAPTVPGRSSAPGTAGNGAARPARAWASRQPAEAEGEKAPF